LPGGSGRPGRRRPIPGRTYGTASHCGRPTLVEASCGEQARDSGWTSQASSLTDAALGLASALLAVGLGFLWHTNLIFAALTVLFAIPAVLVTARRPVALRADHAGITLGSDRPLPPRPAVFISWADVEQIVFYPAYTGSGDRAQYIGVQRREGAPALPYGNKQAPGCPAPGVAAGATRRIKNWRLDRDLIRQPR
jgi:hypothetical protein